MSFDPTVLSAAQASIVATQALAETGAAAQAAASSLSTLSSETAFINDDSRSTYRMVLLGGAAAAIALAGCGSSTPQQPVPTTGTRDPFCEAQDATLARMQHEHNQFDQVVFGGGAAVGLVFGLIIGRIWGKRKAMRKMAAQQPAPATAEPPAATRDLAPKVGE